MLTSFQPTALFRKPTAAETELARRRLLLEALRSTLRVRERTLDDFRVHLLSFEGRYLRQVGRLLKHLDDWEERIAELHVRHNLTQPSEASANSEPSANSEDPLPLDAATPHPTSVALEIKTLFRELAKRIHPDFAIDHADERRRNRLMAQANDAFRRADHNVLHRMLHGSGELADLTSTQATEFELANILLQIQYVRQDIAASEAELDALSQSDLAQLQQRTLQAALAGRDLLAEMASRIKGSIGLAMRQYELDLTRIKRPPATTDVDSLLTAATPTTRRFATRR